ncbi:kynureninase 1 [Eremomyces bilateralis CBS 781.70]|uniref:Kynureninase n=1 Tax=Eremomyces bilateralis CBS 781.70 TaxID=1392243 RepID=A0A6G1G4P3_9PEZI|nr:kynureninase 1 [Eremomyces bilateralis CBS 781.70]KAF1813033.1 kynureninase 1 [Eremomyces bilateralis CBS 781.70]
MKSGKYTIEEARQLDAADPLGHLREEFTIPSKGDLKRRNLKHDGDKEPGDEDPSIYLCGNSLGLQPKRTTEYIDRYLKTWGTQGVYGHFKEFDDALTPPWVDIDLAARGRMATVVGANEEEVAIMGTLTANLHFLLASFYKPTKEKYKIIIEGKAFPSDHYAVLSQLAHHSLPAEALITIDPPDPEIHYLPLDHILSTISAHASETALVLLPGVHYYSGQFLEIQKITAHAHGLGITIGWDLAHAVGNVPLALHDWDVDFATWCSYKYLNAGPGAISGLFVHGKHGEVVRSPSATESETEQFEYTPRFSGWWGSEKSTRFRMEPVFRPIPGAAGWQVSNPSVLDTTSLAASLSVFARTSIASLRERSLQLTQYLVELLDHAEDGDTAQGYRIITSRNRDERGAQISIKLDEGLLDKVMEILEKEAVVVDERRPDVVRVAPTPLYNTFEDVWNFVKIFRAACKDAIAAA